MRTAALIAAAGRGTRASGPLPKQYAAISGVPVLARSLTVFLSDPHIDLVQVVIGAGDETLYRNVIAGLQTAKLQAAVSGGATRQASVLGGLRALAPHKPDAVLIHDAVRPFVSSDVVGRVIEALSRAPGAVAGLPVADTLKRAGSENRVDATVDRAGLWRAQTPQGFRFAEILAAHEAAAAAGRYDLTDDAAVAEWAGLPVALVLGSEANRKLTTAEDLAMADHPHPLADVRTGSGFDVHRLVAGDRVWLCGVHIPHTQALEGHSDADVALHAVTDALLGAIGDGDIGEHFPNTDPRWKNAPSHVFLAGALARVRARGGVIANVDVTIFCEAPKIAPYRQAMRQCVSELLEIDVTRVGVKATTTEGLGFTGRREGIAALATATVVLR